MAQRGLEGIKKEYDCVVIGAGLGGMTCANSLARSGKSVLLLEHHIHLGGLAAWFKRKKHIFDVALHGFPVGMIKTCRKYWSKDIAGRIVQLKGIRFDNPQFSFETTYDRDDFTQKLVNYFGVEPQSVEGFFDATRKMNFYDGDTKTTRELFEEHFPGRSDVHRLLMEPITYANGSTLDEPAISYGIVFSNFMSKGVYTFVGGTDLIISLMEKELEKNGVDARTKVLVEKIAAENGKVTGVVANGQLIKSRSVVSNANLLTTVLGMLDNGALSEAFRRKAQKVRINNSSCQVYMGIKEGEKIDYIGDLLFTSTASEFDADMMKAKDPTSMTFSVYYPESRPGHDRYTIVASMNADYNDWKDLPEEQYKADKEKLIETVLDRLEKYIPDIRSKTDHLEAATPLTFERYTRHVGGSSFGTKFEGLELAAELPKEVPGLFFTGSVGIIMSGWLGAANYGVIVANNADRYLETGKT